MRSNFRIPGARVRTAGFALVVVLSLMVLLAVLAVGLLGLSAVSLRASGTGEARAEAQANARLGLMLALGELQKTMGPDQGVSARASVLGFQSGEPNLLGAWSSWRPDPLSPDYNEKSERFLGWLGSFADPEASRTISAASSEMKDPIVLLGSADATSAEGVGRNDPRLRAERVGVEASSNRSGSYAWAVMDESLKAPIQLAETESEGVAGAIARRTAPENANAAAAFPELSRERLGNPEKIVSLDTAVVAVGITGREEIARLRSEVTPYSLGLLTDPVDGGFKQDLTTVFESASMSPNIKGSTDGSVYSPRFGKVDGAPQWNYLKSHYELYKRVGGQAQGTPRLELTNKDLAINSLGLQSSPNTERLLPVIAKLQIMFSMVSHPVDRPGLDWRQFYDSKGGGHDKYRQPFLVYDPVVTLYNPYDVAIDVSRLRIRIWDPPVVFRLRKNDHWLRDDFEKGIFLGLNRLQAATQFDPNGRKFFTLSLSELMSNDRPGKAISLQPGELRVFSPWVDKDWTWGLEVSAPANARSFFEWNQGFNFSNVDGRTKNQFGVETVPGWNARAGFQMDHFSLDGNRPKATLYDFELANNWIRPWVAIKNEEIFGLEAKPGRTVADRRQPDFVVDLLGNRNVDPTRDILRTYRFTFSDVVDELSKDPSNPVISRSFRVGDIRQDFDDKSTGGKSPFAILTMTAKTTNSPMDFGRPWLHNHPVVEGAEQFSSRFGNALDSYDVRIEEVADFNDSPGGIELDPETNQGFYGATAYSNGGVTNVPMFRVPVLPVASLGDLITANLVTSSHLPRVTHAFGNSRAHPIIPSSAVTRKAPAERTGLDTRSEYNMLDHSYLLNEALWDSFYFSTIGSFQSPLMAGGSRKTLLEGFLSGERGLLNERLVPMVSGHGDPKQIAEMFDRMSDEEFSRSIGEVLGVAGPFNVNSDSQSAWRAILSALQGDRLLGWGLSDLGVEDRTLFPRFGLPIFGDVETGQKGSNVALSGQKRWAGIRGLSSDQIERLARAIVVQIRLKGAADQAPSLTMAEFVNRRLGTVSSLQTLAGVLQTAIDESGVNDEYRALDGRDLSVLRPPSAYALTNVANPEAREGWSNEGSPPMLTQGDLLMALAPIATVRGDTFTIRAYGDSKDGSGRIQARAWCEAVVQRVPSYIDPEDPPATTSSELSETNRRFGRRFRVTSFRWLSSEEI